MATRKTPSPSKTRSTPKKASPQKANESLPYDGSYRSLFAHPAMVKDLLKGAYLPAELLREVDPELPITPLSHHHTISLDEGKITTRIGDMAFEVGNIPEAKASRSLLLLEHQSSTDPTMEVRMLVYAGLIWQQDALTAPLVDGVYTPPPTLTLILYNGKPPWELPAATLRERIPTGRSRGHLQSNPRLRKAQPDLAPLLLDIQRLDLPERPRGLCDILFALEQLRLGNLARLPGLVEQLPRLLAGKKHLSLRRAFLSFILNLLPEGARLLLPDPTTLEGVVPNLTQAIEDYYQQGRQEGRQEGTEALLMALLKVQGTALNEAEMKRLTAYISTHAITSEIVQQTPAATVLSWVRKPKPAPRKKS